MLIDYWNKIKSIYHAEGKWLLFWLILLVLEVVHLKILFGGASFLAGGDNFTYLLLGRQKMYPYLWDNFYPFGVKSFNIPTLLGFQFYSQIMPFFSGPSLQRIIIFTLIFLKFVFFTKLARLLISKAGPWELIPPILFLSFNAFASLNAFTYYQLLYVAYLPLFLYYFIKIFESQKLNFSDVTLLTLWSVFFSPLNANPPLSATIFIPPIFYFAVNYRKIKAVTLKNMFIFGSLWTAVNLWWMYPLLTFFVSMSGQIIGSGTWFTATAVSNLFQNFRLIGQWAWYSSHFIHAYYPYSRYYDQPLVVLCSFFVIFLAFFEATRSGGPPTLRRARVYLLGLALLGLFLLGGSRLPFGFFYQLIFNYFPGFRIYREPFTKFSEIYALAISLLLYLFLVRIFLEKKGLLKWVLWSVVTFSVFVSIKPAFLAQGVVDYWNGSVRTYRVKIPDYWLEIGKYAQENLLNERILTTPRLIYGSAWNWPNGFTSADDVAPVFLNQSNNVLRGLFAPGGSEESFINGLFSHTENREIFFKYLALMGIDNVLQENDLDWRYINLSPDPQKANEVISNFLTLTRSFGRFDSDYLQKIPNEDPNPFVRNKLTTKLLNLPALNLYRVPGGNRIPRIYAPAGIVFTSDNYFENIDRLLTLPQLKIGDLYLKEPLPTEIDFLGSKEELSATDSAQILGQRSESAVPQKTEFIKINPTRYSVRITGAPRQYFLAFLERFDSGWKVYGPRQNSDEKNHYLANGFANAWLINSDNLAGNRDYNLVIEYRPQIYFQWLLTLLIVVSGLSSLYLIYRFFLFLKIKL